MMDCKYLENKVWLYVEEDLEPRKQEAATRHIRSCQHCAGLVEEVRSSQEWLKSCGHARFDVAFMDSVRRGARQRIAEQKASRLEFTAVFARVNWKPLIIACPILLLICWVALNWAIGTRLTSRSPGSVAADGRSTPRGATNNTDHSPEDRVAVKGPPMKHRRRPIEKRVDSAPTDNSGDKGNLLAGSGTYQPPLRIEIQTEDPNVRIIWFATPGDGSVPFGPDK